MIDPGTVMSGLNMVGDLAGGIYNAVTAKDRKKKFLKEQQAELLHQMRRQRAASLGYPVSALDAAYNMQKLKKQADEQFKIDPMTFVPFVNKATQFASQVDRAARQDAAKLTDPDGFSYDPETLRVFVDDEERRRRLDAYSRGETYGSYNPWSSYAR